MNVDVFKVPPPDPNKPSNASLARYVGGQAEIHNAQENYLFRGEIKSIALEGEGHSEEYHIEFNWVAQFVDFVWKPAENKSYHASSLIYACANIGPGEEGGDRLAFQSNITGELVILFPPDGSKLDYSRIQQ